MHPQDSPNAALSSFDTIPYRFWPRFPPLRHRTKMEGPTDPQRSLAIETNLSVHMRVYFQTITSGATQLILDGNHRVHRSTHKAIMAHRDNTGKPSISARASSAGV